MRVIIAARLSQKADAQTGIMSQDQDAREWSEDEGHEVIETVADYGSGTKAMWDRTNLGPWVTDPKLIDRYDAIVAAKQDRLSRADWRDESDLRRWAEDNGKTLFVVDRDLRWPPRKGAHHDDDVEAWNRGAEAAHREWNSTSRRYLRMHKNLRENNLLTGKPPYGYRATVAENTTHKTLTIHPPEAEIVREAVNRYLAGETIAQITADFTKRNIPGPKYKGQPGKWHTTTIAKMLRTPSIAGRRVNAAGKTDLTYEGIITWTVHEQLVARLDSRAHRAGISPTNAYMLTGLLTDWRETPMRGMVTRGGRRPREYYYYYRPGLMIPVDEADQQVVDFITYVYGGIPNPVRRWHPGKNHFDEIARLRQDRNDLDDLADDYETRHAEITAEIRRLAKLDKEHPDPGKWVWEASDESVADFFKKLDTAKRRDWLIAGGWKAVAVKDGDGYKVVSGPGKDWAEIAEELAKAV